MRHHFIPAILAALVITAAAQAQRSPQPAPPQPVGPAPAKPYKPVAITLPAPSQDQSFEAFRGQLAEVAKRKDRAALGRFVVSKGFFWQRERGDSADKKKSGLDNLAVALGLGGDGAGWDMLAGYADDPTASNVPNRKNTVCAPADPVFNGKDMDDLLDATQTDVVEWAYPVQNGIEVRATPQTAAPVVERLGLYFVRVLADNSPAAAVASYLRVVTPSGKAGYIPSDAVAPIGNDQLCYVKEADGWKISGYVGAGDAQ